MIYKDYVSQIPELFEMLLSADSIVANRIIKFYCTTLEQLKSETWTFPLFVHNNDGSGIAFMRKPFASTDKEFSNYINNFGTYYAYKYQVKKVFLMLFETATEDTFAINTGLSTYDLPSFEPELEIKMQEIDEYIKQCKNSRK